MAEDGQGFAGRRMLMIGLGWLLILISPLVGLLPGPGFIIVFPVGLAILLKHSRWAQRAYARFRRRFPSHARWTDWSLRRRHHQRERPPFPRIRRGRRP